MRPAVLGDERGEAVRELGMLGLLGLSSGGALEGTRRAGAMEGATVAGRRSEISARDCRIEIARIQAIGLAAVRVAARPFRCQREVVLVERTRRRNGRHRPAIVAENRRYMR